MSLADGFLRQARGNERRDDGLFDLCAGPSVGVQLNAPDDALIVAPAGPPTRLNVSVCAGVSVSDALAVKVSVLPSSTALLPIALSVGAVFAF